MPQLPLKLRLDVRDQWENEKSAVQKSLSELSQLVGLKVNVLLEMPMIWTELQKHFPDQGTFVPNIIGVVKTWTDCLIARLEDEANAEWTERLLDEVQEASKILRARVQTHPGTRVSTTWDRNASLFAILVPRSSPPYQTTRALFAADFDKLFSAATTAPVSHTQVGEGYPTVNLLSNIRAQPERIPAILAKALPQLETLDRPDILFPQQMPYHMIVRDTHLGITVQGSHQPSLELLANYLQKWIRTMRNNIRKIPVLKVELQESHWGVGVLFDSLVIEPADKSQTWVAMNPMLIISFIEGVLGYQSVPRGRGTDDWYFRREERFE